MRRCLPVLVLWIAMMVAAWAQSLEVISLRYQTADQVLPQLLPLLEPGGALSGTGTKLFLRTSVRNRADIERVLAEIDRAPRRLVIHVRQDGDRNDDSRGAELSGDSASRSLGVRVYSTRERGNENVAQSVQTIEGGRAWINVGQSLPLPLRQVTRTPNGVVVADTVVYRDIGTGFSVEPRLMGDRVLLDISPERSVPGAMPGSAEVRQLSTTVSGRLGEWMRIGGSVETQAVEREGIAARTARGGGVRSGVWLKVEELP